MISFLEHLFLQIVIIIIFVSITHLTKRMGCLSNYVAANQYKADKFLV